ncbi:MAG: AbrB/MazE/SpoVT family DNA-binding domain-containing protein [Anaerolineales bacterium]|nr:AbrB/MazE/SpoVT family DNA-binding domain-containing protein [Anaerolineales bacterium]
MDTTIQVRQRGTITLPADLRQKYQIKQGDSFQLVDLDGLFLLTPLKPMVPELSQEIERLRLEAGLEIDDLLALLREEREKYTAGNDA